MKQTLLSLCLLACFSYGCQKKDITVPDSSLNGLFGSWDLVMKSGGFSGGVQTPLTMGYQQSLKFTKEGRCYTYKDGSRTGQDNFEFEYQAQGTNAPYEMHYIIKYKEQSFSQWVHIQNDTLFLDDAFCNDCYSYLYVKQPD
jgi:hypothetical protein